MCISIGRKKETTILGSLLLLAIFASAQQPSPSSSTSAEGAPPDVIRIGVPLMENTSTRTINPKMQRDSLVRAFQPDKKKKGKQAVGPRIEAVPLDSGSSADAAREARDKNCDYVLYTNVVELREPGDPLPHEPRGTISAGRDPLGTYPDPTVMHDPVHYAEVDYRLQRVGDLEPQLALSVSGQEHTDENGTVQHLLFLIVDRVKSDLRENPRHSPE